MEKQIQWIIFETSSILLWPVIILLFYSFFRSLYVLGAFFVEYLERSQRKADFVQALWMDTQEIPGKEERLLKVEYGVAERLDQSRLWLRLGPILGLCGTLIPLGPGLLALAQNDLNTLSGNLIVAFGTTVLGMVSGGIHYFILLYRQRWYDFDFAHLVREVES